jgi:Uma2 family endonuclease
MAHATLPVTFRPQSGDLPSGDWPTQGAWTVADWERLPSDDEARYEVIDGALFMTTAPSASHQWTNTRIGQLIANHLDAQEEPSGVVINTAGVILPTGAVIPDVVYIRMENIGILTPERIVGVPDLVVEIASPGTVSYDRREKQDAYARSGVGEYWWVSRPTVLWRC